MPQHFSFSYDDHLRLGDRQLWVSDLGTVGASVDSVRDGWLWSLKQALGRLADTRGSDYASLWLSDVPESRFDDELSPPSGIGLHFKSDQLFVWVDFYSDDPEPADAIAAVLAWMRPALARRDAEVVGTRIFHDSGVTAGVEVLFRWPTARRTVADAYAFGREILALSESAAKPKNLPETVLGLMRAGLWDDLLGVSESGAFEAKRSHYQLDQARSRLELAKDVGALANASGGILVIGLKTQKHEGRDVVASVAPVPLDRGTAHRYEKALRRLLHPLPRGLVIEALPRGDDASTGLVLLEVPSQDDALRPVLIRDGLKASMGAGTLIGIPIRVGEDTDWLTAERLHAWLAAGRRLIG